MFKNMHERLMHIAEADSEREDRLGASCPIQLSFSLVGGHVALGYALIDSVNSVDDETIDVRRFDADFRGPVAVIAIAHIAMLVEVWPTEEDEARAIAAKGAAA